MSVSKHPMPVVPEPVHVLAGVDRPDAAPVVPIVRVEVVRDPGRVVVTRSDVSDPVPLLAAVVRVVGAVGVSTDGVVAYRPDDGGGVSVEVRCDDPVKSAVVFERLVGAVAVPDDGANWIRPPDQG